MESSCAEAISICFHVCKTYWEVTLLYKKKLVSSMSQYLEELAVSFGQYFPANADPRKGNIGIVSGGIYQAQIAGVHFKLKTILQ